MVNGASFQAGIASGSWVTINGTNLSSTTRNWTDADFLNGAMPTQLDNVSVTINGQPAYVAYVSPKQLNVLAPSDTALGRYTLATRPDYSDVGPPNLFPGTPMTPASAGDIITLWGTGFGATNPSAPKGQLVPSDSLYSLPDSLTILVGNVPAQVISAVLTPGEAGVYQIAIRIPNGTPGGDQPVVAQVAGVTSPAGVYVNIQ